jgi:hypothetical protein
VTCDACFHLNEALAWLLRLKYHFTLRAKTSLLDLLNVLPKVILSMVTGVSKATKRGALAGSHQ